MALKTFTLHDSGGTQLLALYVRDTDTASDMPLRNVEGAQPPGANIQGAFGDEIHKVGVLERDVGLCDSYTSLYHGLAALQAALLETASVRFEGWELPIVRAVGVVDWQRAAGSLRAKIRLLPSSSHWRYLTGSTAVAAASQAGTVITGSGFTSADVGKVLVFANDAEALITSYSSATTVGSDVDQTIASQAATLYTAAQGVL